MARIRTIKPEFWKHEDLSELPEATHMLAAALLNHADDEGYFNANPGLIKSECCPLREPSVSIQDSLISLSRIGYIRLFKGADGKRYGQVVTFDDHQRVNRPTASKIKPLCTVIDDCVIPHPQLTEDSPPEGRKGTGNREGKGTGKEQEESSLRSDMSAKDSPTPPDDLAAKKAERLAAVTVDASEAYNAILGKPNGQLASVRIKVGQETRQSYVRRVVKTAREICEAEFGSRTITREFWNSYFAFCAEDSFLNGTGPYGGAHKDWRPDFEFLTRKETMLKVYEKSDAGAGAEAA